MVFDTNEEYEGWYDKKRNAEIVNDILNTPASTFEEIVKYNDVEIEKEEKKDFEVGYFIDNYANKVDLVEQFIELIPLYYDKAGIWWIWYGGNKRWEQVDEIDILSLVRGASNANVIKTQEKTEILNALRLRARKNKPKDPKDTWIQFKEIVIDIKTGEKFKATSDYFMTNPIPYKLGRTDKTPNMDRIFEEWVGKENVKTLYQIIAYCMLPDYPISRIFCLIGSGLNGKSKYLSLLRKFVGIDNCTSTDLDKLLNSKFEVARLYKKLICLMGETNFNEMSKTSLLKSLTGGDLIGFEFKNKNPFESMNYAKIIISTNNLPTTTDKSVGFYRRWQIIDFPNQFNEKKDILKDIPEKEYENLANKCVGLLMDLLYKENREFHNEGNIEERMLRYEEKSDFLNKFLDDYVIKDSIDDTISKKDFHKKFADWCRENRHRILAENTLGKKMKEKGYEDERKYFQWLFDGKGGRILVWSGVKWKD